MACPFGSTTRARPSGPRGRWRWLWRGPVRRSSRPAAGVTIAGVADIVEAGPPPAWPMPKAARMALAADAATPVEAGTTEIAVSVTVSFRIV